MAIAENTTDEARLTTQFNKAQNLYQQLQNLYPSVDTFVTWDE